MSRRVVISAICLAVLAFGAGIGFVAITSNRQLPSLTQLAFVVQAIDRRVEQLEADMDERLRDLEKELLEARQAAERLPPSADARVDPGAESSGEPEDASETPPAAQDLMGRLLSRLDELELRVRGLEEDPIQRAYDFLESQNFELRRQGIFSLERIAPFDPQAKEAIRQMLRDQDPRVRLAALDTLADINDKESASLVSSLLADANVEVRRETINTLARLGATDAGAEIASLLKDTDARIREQAADVLGRLRSQDGTELLIQALYDSSEQVKGEAIASLGEVGAKKAIPLLRELYEKSPGPHRNRLIWALKSLGDNAPFEAEVRRITQVALTDPSESSRREAIRTLSWFAPDRGRAVFEQARQDPSEQVRREAERALRERR